MEEKINLILAEKRKKPSRKTAKMKKLILLNRIPYKQSQKEGKKMRDRIDTMDKLAERS